MAVWRCGTVRQGIVGRSEPRGGPRDASNACGILNRVKGTLLVSYLERPSDSCSSSRLSCVFTSEAMRRAPERRGPWLRRSSRCTAYASRIVLVFQTARIQTRRAAECFLVPAQHASLRWKRRELGAT